MPTASPATSTDPRTAVVRVGLGPLSFDDVVAVARRGVRVEIAADALAEVRRTRAVIEALADDPQPHYGVSTGFRPSPRSTSRSSVGPSCSAA